MTDHFQLLEKFRPGQFLRRLWVPELNRVVSPCPPSVVGKITDSVQDPEPRVEIAPSNLCEKLRDPSISKITATVPLFLRK